MSSTPTALEERPASSAGFVPVRPAQESAAQRGHIGRVVAGSLIGGLAAVVLCVAILLAGEVEWMISGAALFIFAVSWATLAILSEAWTDQPQRWALVPAVFMAIAGAAVVGFAPTGNELGWFWPPAVVALVGWIIVRARRDLHSRTRIWILYPVCAALVFSAVGGAYETYRESNDNLPMAGRLIDVGGHKLHLECIGSGSPTVVLEAGLGEPSTMMSGWIAPNVASSTRVCVYDRAGRAWSESASYEQNSVDVAVDLHTLLHRAGEHGPFVLAGHGAGGIYVMNFARVFPSDVAGVVLLDAMHSDETSDLLGWGRFASVFRNTEAALPSLARLGVGRLIARSVGRGLPPRARVQERTIWSTPRHYRSLRDELAELPAEIESAKALVGLGNRPLIVLTAGRGAPRGWMPPQDHLATLSSNSVHLVLPSATHSMLTEDRGVAAQSSRAIVRVVDAVRNRSTLRQQAG